MMAEITKIDSRTIKLARKDNAGQSLSITIENLDAEDREIVLRMGASTLRVWLKDFLDAVVELSPEHIAYQFPHKGEDDDE